jgi:hypothetical protein
MMTAHGRPVDELGQAPGPAGEGGDRRGKQKKGQQQPEPGMLKLLAPHQSEPGSNRTQHDKKDQAPGEQRRGGHRPRSNRAGCFPEQGLDFERHHRQHTGHQIEDHAGGKGDGALGNKGFHVCVFPNPDRPETIVFWLL